MTDRGPVKEAGMLELLVGLGVGSADGILLGRVWGRGISGSKISSLSDDASPLSAAGKSTTNGFSWGSAIPYSSSAFHTTNWSTWRKQAIPDILW
jgi:hypothetical protein